MKPIIHNTKRGAVTFTLLLFMMLLISVALMYYYFMRTRALQAEVVELKRTIPGAAAIDVESTDEINPAPVNTLGSAINNVSSALAPTTRTIPQRDVGATPVGEVPAQPLIPVEPTPSPVPPPPATNPPVTADETPVPPQESEPEPTPQPTPVKPIKSMYDVERPAMKIRTPRRPAPENP